MSTSRSGPEASDPARLLFGAYRHGVLSLLLPRAEDSFHVREIARLTGVPAGSLHRELRLLRDAGILKRTPAGNQVRYSANRTSPVYRGLMSILSRTASKEQIPHGAPAHALRRMPGALPIATGELANICRRYGVRKMALFGSAARGELGPGSDVDLLVEFDPGGNTTSFDLVHMQTQLSALFGARKIGISTPAILRNPFRRRTIERDLKVLYAA